MRDALSSGTGWGIRRNKVAVILHFFLATFLTCEIQSAPEVFTNSFYVQLHDGYGRSVADAVAKQHGFQNVGPVRPQFIYLLIFSSSMLSPRVKLD
jgi:hypothetical protein